MIFEEFFLTPMSTLLAFTKSVYETFNSLPILELLQENVATIGVSVYLLWYIKAYLSVSLPFGTSLL